MDEEGLFKNLPNEILRKILEYEGTLNLRCASPSLEKRVTSLMRSKYNTFHIPPISDINCVYIRNTLVTAMAKEQAPESLKLCFCPPKFTSDFNIQYFPVKKEILLDFKDKVKLLDIRVHDNEELLLEPNTVFESLESLLLYDIEDDVSVAACEAMLNKHAHNLKHLGISYLDKNISVPSLPRIDHLSLCGVEEEEVAWPLYEQVKDTITRFDICEYNTKLYPPLQNDEESVSSNYKMKNLKHLNIRDCVGAKFVMMNAENLISLSLGFVEVIHSTINIEWPLFPSLRELSITINKYLPILLKCNATLECLNLGNADEIYYLEMPRLTDLYNTSHTNSDLLNEILRTNHKSLEFLVLQTNIPKLDDSMRMERVVKVVAKHDPKYKPFPVVHNSGADREKLARMFPNAEVVIVDDKKQFNQHIKPRMKRKGFTIELPHL